LSWLTLVNSFPLVLKLSSKKEKFSFEERVGYHYTSWENWLKIQKEGLKPYYLKNLQNYKIKGIWIWPERLLGLSHVGSLLYHVSSKRTLKIVLLRVQYNPHDYCYVDSESCIVETKHNGQIGDWSYHTGEIGVIVASPISPEKITLERVYDLEELLV